MGEKPRLLILTGPQGSGNHLFSKLFALHPEVFGWTLLNDVYWAGHHEEPFASCWHDPSLLANHHWNSHAYHVTSISSPYIRAGEPRYPDYGAFLEALDPCARPTVAVIGRDRSILEYQQQRLRGQVTLNLEQLPLHDVHFLSTELLFLYRTDYLRSLARQLAWPIDFKSARIQDILSVDPNRKYTRYIDEAPIDGMVDQAYRSSRESQPGA